MCGNAAMHCSSRGLIIISTLRAVFPPIRNRVSSPSASLPPPAPRPRPAPARMSLSVAVLPSACLSAGGSELHALSLSARFPPVHHVRAASPPAAPFLQLHRYAPRFGSFVFVPPSCVHAPHVHSSGALLLATRVDPLFVLLVYAANNPRSHMYMPLAQLFANDDAVRVADVVQEARLLAVCERKSVADGGEFVWRLDADKVQSWYQRKWNRARQAKPGLEKMVEEWIPQMFAQKWRHWLQKQGEEMRAGREQNNHLAVQALMEEARLNNQREQRHAATTQRNQPPRKKKRPAVDKSAMQFWSNLSSSSTKPPRSAN